MLVQLEIEKSLKNKAELGFVALTKPLFYAILLLVRINEVIAMIYDDIIVPIPAKKRIKRSDKGHRKEYVYEILQRKGKDSPKDIVSCVGVAINDTEMNPNERYFELHPDSITKKPENEPGVFDDQIHIGSSMLLRAAAEHVGLTRILRQVFRGYDELIQSLLEYYMLERESASQLFKYYLRDHYTGLNYIPSEAALSKFFNDYLTHDKIKEFLNLWLTTQLSYSNTKCIDINFDSTNFNVSSKGIDSAEHGKPKVEEGLPQINIAYFLNRETGLPVYYDMYYGSIIDMEHCQTAMEKLRSVKPGIKASFVMDRGYFSSGNLNYFDENGFKFLCMGKTTKEFKRLVSLYPSFRIAKAENRIFGNIYGVKERGGVFQEGGKEYYIYFYYNIAAVATELPLLQDRAEYASSFLVGKKDNRGYIRNTFGKLVDLELDDHQVIVSAEPNYDYLDHFRDECGYFWIISNEDMTPKEALESYRHRDSVEKTFRGIKTDSDFNKTYSRSDTAFEAKSLMAFLTAVLRAEITMRLRPYFVQYSSETSQTVLKELEKIKAEDFDGKYRLRFALTARQKQILSFYDMNSASAQRYTDSVNDMMKTIDNGGT